MAAESATGQPAVNCMNFDELESRPSLSMDCQRAGRRQPLAATTGAGGQARAGELGVLGAQRCTHLVAGLCCQEYMRMHEM